MTPWLRRLMREERQRRRDRAGQAYDDTYQPRDGRSPRNPRPGNRAGYAGEKEGESVMFGSVFKLTPPPDAKRKDETEYGFWWVPEGKKYPIWHSKRTPEEQTRMHVECNAVTQAEWLRNHPGGF